jgi:hypothetical protein
MLVPHVAVGPHRQCAAVFVTDPPAHGRNVDTRLAWAATTASSTRRKHLPANAFELPVTLPHSSLKDLLTIFLDPTKGSGGILNVVNGTGGSSTIANPDVPVTVVSYP